MHWSPLVPELVVTDLRASVSFWVDVLGAEVLFERPDPPFVYLGLGEAQVMLEQDHDGAWVTADPVRPRGRGVNLQIEVADVAAIATRCAEAGIRPFRDLHESWYDVGDGAREGQLEFLVQDPDGYLLRTVQPLGRTPS
ncbi:VOC family protein [Pseudonocardia sp. NPDC049635]|uniref:bleomycin resistance protein n=1 Tax=Pseudonocardia sp. NPDC049635 TaxID=3155506 RepID=UPI0033D50618